MASKKLNKLFPPSGSCTCDICKNYCSRPGWWTVDEAIKAIGSDYADRFMLEISPEYSFAVISPAFKGAERNFALQEFSKKGCTFFNNDLCELFDTGLMPLECRFCHHTRIGEGKRCHDAIEKEWNTYKGQKTVETWMEKTNFKWKDYYYNLISNKRNA
jgi:hypothetical protein